MNNFRMDMGLVGVPLVWGSCSGVGEGLGEGVFVLKIKNFRMVMGLVCVPRWWG